MVIPEHIKCNSIQPHSLGGPDAVPPVFPGNALGMHLRAADLEGFPVQHELLVPFPSEPEHNGGSSGKSGFLYILDSLRASPCQCSHSDGHQCGRPTETILLHHVEQLIHLKTVANNNFFLSSPNLRNTLPLRQKSDGAGRNGGLPFRGM